MTRTQLIFLFFIGYPLFPGENEQEQLACIMEIQNVPEKHLIEKSSRKKLFFGKFPGRKEIICINDEMSKKERDLLVYMNMLFILYRF